MNFKEYYFSKILLESKQNIINLGFPKIITDILFKRFGKNAYTIAKWFRENKTHLYSEKEIPKDWWTKSMESWTSGKADQNLADLVNLYNAASTSAQEYIKVATDMELAVEPEEIDEYYLADMKKETAIQLEEDFLSNWIFKGYTLFRDIFTGSLTNLDPYKKLSFKDAQEKYNKKKIFQDTKPFKVYTNGYKWIDIGQKCELVGDLMKNCGSAGVMSLDSNRTIFTLFDKENKPHVMITYSPNRKRLSGDQGAGSTPAKPEYHPYVLDLIDTLGVKFDAANSKSIFLGLKYQLKDQYQSIEQLSNGDYNKTFQIIMNNGDIFYSNGYSMISKEDLMKLKQFEFRSVQPKNIEELIGAALNHYNRSDIKDQYPAINIVEL